MRSESEGGSSLTGVGESWFTADCHGRRLVIEPHRKPGIGDVIMSIPIRKHSSLSLLTSAMLTQR